jgi:stress-induced morphogen
MTVDVKEVEERIRNHFAVTHLEIEDVSNGCGENYAILLVSEVRCSTTFEAVSVTLTLSHVSHLKEKLLSQDIA